MFTSDIISGNNNIILIGEEKCIRTQWSPVIIHIIWLYVFLTLASANLFDTAYPQSTFTHNL